MASAVCGSLAEKITFRISFGYSGVWRNRGKALLVMEYGKEVASLEQRIQNLSAEKQKQVLETASDMEKPCSPAESGSA